MKKRVTNKQSLKIEEAKYLIANFKPFQTIYFFEGKYHAVVHDENNAHPIIKDWLYKIPAVEAEQNLRSPEWSLWNLGDPPGKLPESCPSFIYTNIFLNVPPGEYLQMCFDLYYKQFIIDNATKN